MISLGMQRAYNRLSDEFKDWTSREQLVLGSPDEHLDDETLTQAQRAWIRGWVIRWINVKLQLKEG